jgi:hypothetical protein
LTKLSGCESLTADVKHSHAISLRFKTPLIWVAVLILSGLAAALSLNAQTVVYQTGFAAPGFALGNLAGQNGWSAGASVSKNAAAIISAAGGQELQISGSLVGLTGPNSYYSSFTKSLSNYSPLSSGTPIVDVSANAWLKFGASANPSWQYAFLILNDQNGNAYEGMGIDTSGNIFGQNWGSPNNVASNGIYDTNGFHNLKVELNFTNRTMVFFVDGYALGSMPFNTSSSNLLGSVSFVLQGGSPIVSTLLVTNLSVTAGTSPTIGSVALQIASAGPCLLNQTYGVPTVGDSAYAIKAVINIKGTPQNPFRIKWTLANNTNYSGYMTLGSGSGYWWWFVVPMALDDVIPWSFTCDPDGVSGDTNLANHIASGTFTPVPPTNAVELYSPRMMHGYEYYTLNFQPGSGNLNNLWVLFGVPTTHGAQTAIGMTSPTNGQTIITPPCNVPVFVISRTNVPATTFQDTNYFTVQLNNIMVNPAILRTNTWAAMASMTTNWTEWIAPDQMDQSTNSVIATFVQQSLPANYRSVLTPYDTARTLHRAVEKALTYQSPPFHLDAVDVLQDGVADCGGFAHLLTACLRNVGIPARMISGFWEGDTQWHCRTEFHLPNVQWLLADPTDGQGADPTGTYAYYFGYVPNANEYLAVDTGDAHILPYNNFTFLQVPNWWWSGGGTYNSYSATTYLQPNGVLNPTNVAKSSTSFYLSDAPTEGSVVIQTSTNLISWSSVATNSSAGTNINYSFPDTNRLRQFYRAQVSP